MWAMISIRITTIGDGTLIFTMVWDGVPVIIPGMILGITAMVDGLDGEAPGTIADGTPPGTTADGTLPGMADGTILGITAMADGMILGITAVIGVDMEVVTTMDFMMDITAA